MNILYQRNSLFHSETGNSTKILMWKNHTQRNTYWWNILISPVSVEISTTYKSWMIDSKQYMLYNAKKDVPQKYISYSSSRCQNFYGVWERQTATGRQCQTAILIRNFFVSWPYQTVLSSRLHLALHLFLRWRGVLNRCPAVGCCLSRALLMIASWHWLKIHIDPNWHGPSREHLHISFHNTHNFRSTTWLLPLIYTSVSCS